MFRLSTRETHPMSDKKTIWIVDGAYLFNHGRNKPFDYLKLKAEIERANGGRLHEAYYLNTTPDIATDSQNAFHSWLKSAAPRGPKMRVQLYSLKELNCTCPSCGQGFSRSVQKGVDVGIATLIVKLAAQNCYDRLILSAGDGDFEDAITYIKSDLHKEFWLHGAMANLSTDLQCYADEVLWIDDMHPAIDKDKPGSNGDGNRS
ncbi:hypothetical protein CATMQ487_33860 [Sphaerotilus microaerophilus]|uniref:NYN domain-containing protein n=2 Tax=Sphaerotilus microaerophilus TaxID=2914710 RepID=A0ABN6PTH6_9BURK|nr:hypothetical protein CATMQ487_33860 [Sphaerotilus sp. FB-5]